MRQGRTRWKAMLRTYSTYKDVDPTCEAPVWLEGTLRHAPGCYLGQLQQQVNLDALAAKDELLFAAKSGRMDNVEAGIRVVRREFKCACPSEVTHLGTVVPCCDKFVSIPLSGERDTSVFNPVHLHVPTREKVHLHGTAILCLTCYDLYTLHDGWLVREGNAKELGLTAPIDRQWLEPLELEALEGLLH